MAADHRRRMVVEEVGEETTPQAPIEEIKEKVEELHEVTEDLNEDIAKAEQVQEDIADAVEEVEKASASQEVSEEDNDNDVEVEDVPEEEVLPYSEHYEDEHHESHNHDHGTEHEHASEPTQMHVHNHDNQEFGPHIKNPGGTNPLVIIIPGIFLLGALLGGIYFYQKGLNLPGAPAPTPMVSEAPAATTAPSASPSAVVDLSKYPINVLNGSGITGEAGKLKTSLTTAGFNVSGTGNATSTGFTKTVIKAKADVPAAFLIKLAETLKKTYELDVNQTLATSSTDTVQIVIGSSKAK